MLHRHRLSALFGAWTLRPAQGRLLDVGLLLVLGAAVWLRLSFLSGDPPALLTTDSITYALPANHLAHGQGFDLSLRRTPGYPLFLAIPWATFGDDFHPVVYAQHLVGIVTAALTWLLGRLALGRLIGLLGGLSVALSGPQIIYEQYLMTEALFTLLLVFGTVALVGGLLRSSGRLYVVAGLLYGLCALTRPVGQIFPLLVPLAVMFGAALKKPCPSQQDRRAYGPWYPAGARTTVAIRATLLALVGFGLVLLPWIGRNWLVGGAVTGSSALGKTLFGRITRHDDGLRFDLPPAGPPETDPRRAEARAMARQAAQDDVSRGSLVHQRLVSEFGYSEAQAYNVMRDVALEVLLAQPGYYVRSSLSGTLELFVGQEESLRAHLERLANARLRREWQENPELAALLPPPVSPEERNRTLGQAVSAVRVYQPSYIAPALRGALYLAGALAIVLRPAWRSAVPLPLVATIVLVLSAFLDGPVPRFRYPVDPFITLTAAAGLLAVADSALRAVRSKVQRPRSGVQAAGLPLSRPIQPETAKSK
jgi:hypothetical protein